MLETLPEQVTL